MKTEASPLPEEGRSKREHTETQALLRLQSWLSPAFPIGAYSYSHGLEWAVEKGRIRDRAALIDWLDADLRFGTGRNEGIFFCEAWRRAQAEDIAPLLALAELSAAYRGTSEFALEATQQGSAFLGTVRRAWPHRQLDAFAQAIEEARVPATLSIACGAACAVHALPLELSAPLYLQSIIANLVTAAVRLIPMGQTDGQLALAALETAVAEIAIRTMEASLEDLGSASFLLDIASMQHESQYTRLFRS